MPNRDDEVREEIESHIAMRAEMNRDSGAPPKEALQSARRQFGNVALVREDTRAVWTSVRLEQLLQDVRYALRGLRRNPGFTAVAVLTLALGIGMNTAVFSVVNAVLLRPLSYPDPDRLIWMTKYRERINEELTPHREFEAWKTQSTSFDRMAGYSFRDSVLASEGDVLRLRFASVTDDFWVLSGAKPLFGRLPEPGERSAVVLSHRLFERAFRGDPGVIGRSVLVEQDRRPATIAGVLPPDFRFEFPTMRVGLDTREVEAYQTEVLQPRGYLAGIVGELKSGANLAAVQAELELISTRVDYVRPAEREAQLRVVPLMEKRVGHARTGLLVLSAAVVFVLLMASANIANLLLARASVRQKEIAIRGSLGAGRSRVLRQFLVESILLAGAGGLAGLLLARWALSVMVRLIPQSVPRLAEATMDARVLGFTLLISIATALLFGFGPAISVWRLSLHDVLKSASKTASATSGRLRARMLLVTAELAIAVVLLTAAGLMLKSFWRMYAHPDGFEPDRMLVAKFELSGPQYFRFPERSRAYVEGLLNEVELLPGVETAAVWKLSGGSITWQGAPPLPPGQYPPQTRSAFVSPGYARVMGLRMVKGRWFQEDERERVIVVNESLARRDFSDREVLGQRLLESGAVVIGVVADLKYSKLDADPQPEFYSAFPASSRFDGESTLVVRATGDPMALSPAIQKITARLDNTQPVFDIMTLERVLAESIAPRRFNLLLLVTFASAALVLSVIGIYGVIAFTTAQRTQEIGVRMALGAERRDVVGMVVRQGMVLALIGILAGLGGALALTRVISTLLYGVEPGDPQTFALVAVTLAAAAFVACLVPALKAALVSPVVALRHE